MEKSLAERVQELEKENASLKEKLKTVADKVYGWENLKIYINSELSELSKFRSPYQNFKYKIESAIGQIIRETFCLKYIKNMDDSNYKQSKIIADSILKFVKDNFVRDEFYCKRIEEKKEES